MDHETNAITEYKKRLVELVKNQPEKWTSVGFKSIEPQISKKDVLDLINNSN